MKKHLIIFWLVILTLICTLNILAKDTNDYTIYAEKLNEFGIFKGTEKGFELDRVPTRVEGAVMFVRLLNGEKEALADNTKHPFKDVPKWASPYIGYLYKYNLTNGVSKNLFGSNDKINSNSMLTFCLRSLGYSDSNGDFAWNKACDFSLNINLITNEDLKLFKATKFNRGMSAKVMYNTLNHSIFKDKLKLYERIFGNSDEIKNKMDLGLEEVHFADKALENAIREQLDIKKDIILKKDLNYPFIDIDCNKIKDLNGLENYTSLENITFINYNPNNLNIEILKTMPNHIGLDFFENNIDDISFLEGFSNVSTLSLRKTKVSNIKVLESLTNLKNLDLSYTNVTDIQSLKNLDKLDSLYLDETNIVNPEIIGKLTSLTYLSLNNTKRSNYNFLNNLTNLTHLFLNKNNISDISFLKNLTSIKYLFLNENSITDISALSNLNNLESLFLSKNKISSLNPLINLTNITWLNASCNNITSIYELSNLTKLKYIFLEANNISNISVLNNMKDCVSLSLSYNNISDITPIKTLVNLNTLSLEENKINDISVLANHTNLIYLYLKNNDIEDISILKNLKNLEAISLNDLMLITNYELISSFKKVQYVCEFKKGEELDKFISKTKSISEKIFTNDMTDYDKIKAVHNWLITNVKYDDYNYEKNTLPPATFNSQGAIMDGIAVCSGYANAFKLLLNLENIECTIMYGEVENVRHAWNIVKLEDNYYQVDVTWDDCNEGSNSINYNFFLISDNTMNQIGKRTWIHDRYPVCDKDHVFQ